MGRVTADRGGERVEKDQQAAPARIDHAGIGQHGELIGGALERRGGGVSRCGQRAGQPGAVGGPMLDRVGGGLQHRDDGAVDHLAAHRRDDQSDAVAQRRPE